MCGVAGYLGGLDQADPRELLNGMGHAMLTRGPDSGGTWFDMPARIGLSHRRLSIMDLSSMGHQPMVSQTGRYIITFNGEIYNHQALRAQLEATHPPDWRGHSDTETLLAGFEAWGLVATLQNSVGMFAIAVWDRHTSTLWLGRDRLGEKPLYYGWQGRGQQAVFLFGSELKALKQHPQFKADVDRGALALLLRHNHVPAPYSIHEGIQKLEPGCLLEVSLAKRTERPRRYWDARAVMRSGERTPFTGTPEQAVDALEELLRTSIEGQMLADVPVGAFLSGGVDSSVVVALMQSVSRQQGRGPVRTFTIGFAEDGYDESPHAQAVATHLGTQHTALQVSASEAQKVIASLPALYCEPFADSSQIPTFLVSKMAREHVTVALSGDGGDELFAGYNRYVLGQRLWGRLERIPASIRNASAGILTGISPDAWDKILAPVQARLPSRWAVANVGDKLHKGASAMRADSTADLYRRLVSVWDDPTLVVKGIEGQRVREPMTVLSNPEDQAHGKDFVQQMMELDMLSYLPDDILCKVDRAAMGASLETRVPFLDHRLVEFAWHLPLQHKLRQGVGKWPLRQVLYRHVPNELIERPKVGFGIPLHDWLRGPLRNWAESLLSHHRLEREGFFHPAPIRQKWEEHVSGRRNWAESLWTILMFQAWLDHEKATPCA